ncbi:unnamed protein product [Penicillium nalgiovense]|nr:unnamed protein product [Penicillium nalgiovense]
MPGLAREDFPVEALLNPLPDLLQAPYKTQSPALHGIKYIGPLHRWRNFDIDVRKSMSKDKFDTVVECTTRDSDIKQEQVYVADETGVQGQFEQAVGQVLGRVFEAEGVDIRFADFKAAGIGYSKTPDAAIVSRNSPPTLKAVGELKTPLVVNHQLSKWYPEEREMCHTIGQVVEYMLDQKLPYGFHSTYEETIFLHLVRVNGVWRVEYSPLVNSGRAGLPLRPCFWHLAKLAAAEERLQNLPPKGRLI